jgi:hypothetical protein
MPVGQKSEPKSTPTKKRWGFRCCKSQSHSVSSEEHEYEYSEYSEIELKYDPVRKMYYYGDPL